MSMIDHKSTIDKIISQANGILVDNVISSNVVADTENVYGVSLKLKYSPDTYVPETIAFSYDQETGFYIDADGVTWEFVKDVNVFRTTAINLLNAIKEKRVKLVENKILGLLSLGKEIIIE